MGLTIHYSGSINKASSLATMIDEVKDIAEIYKWDYHLYETKFIETNFTVNNFNNELYGISFTPPGCETVFLCFLSNGKMSSPANLQLYGALSGKNDLEFLYMLFVKTQFAGPETHIIIIQLLKYLDKKYFRNFSVTDEGEYWETENEELLKNNFERYTGLLQSFSSSLKNNPKKLGETFEEYFARIITEIDNGKKG